jgi:hypothetical protein
MNITCSEQYVEQLLPGQQDQISDQISDKISAQIPTFDKYIGSEINDSGIPSLEVYTIKNTIYIDSNGYYGQNMEYVKFGRKFLIDLVSCCQ